MTIAQVGAQVRLTHAPGYVITEVSGDDVGAIVEMYAVAVSLDGGAPLELPAAPFRVEFAGLDG